MPPLIFFRNPRRHCPLGYAGVDAGIPAVEDFEQ
jgi:hypothetical protein